MFFPLLPACNCSQLGSASLQCHENSTCLCKSGFVGYKCDQCAVNYYFDLKSSQCKQCPICYSLVKEEVVSLPTLLRLLSWISQLVDQPFSQVRFVKCMTLRLTALHEGWHTPSHSQTNLTKVTPRAIFCKTQPSVLSMCINKTQPKKQTWWDHAHSGNRILLMQF